jgi:hypothetical protein
MIAHLRVSDCTEVGLAHLMWRREKRGRAATDRPYGAHETDSRLVAQLRHPRPRRRWGGWSMGGLR